MAYKQRQDSQRGAPRRPSMRPPARSKPKPPNKYYKPQQPPSGGLFSTKLVVALFFIFVFVYIGHSIWAFWTPSVDTMVVRMSIIEAPRSETGIIIRNERVHHAERDGNVEFWVQDNERVRMHTHIASVQDPYMAQVASRELSDVEA